MVRAYWGTCLPALAYGPVLAFAQPAGGWNAGVATMEITRPGAGRPHARWLRAVVTGYACRATALSKYGTLDSDPPEKPEKFE